MSAGQLVSGGQEPFVFDPVAARVKRLRRTVKEWAAQCEEMASFADYRHGRSQHRRLFVTLTYREDGRWQPAHVSEFLKHVREWGRRNDATVPYVWVAETTKRGRLHYHVMLWVPRGLLFPRPDECGWWPHGCSKVETARNPVGYLVKYTSKATPEDVCKLRRVARIAARLRKRAPTRTPAIRLHGHGGLGGPWLKAARDKLLPRWMAKRREAEYMASLQAQLEEEIERQEAEQTTLLRYLYPEDYSPGDEPEWIADAEAEAEYVGRMVAEREESDRLDALIRSGRALLARVVGGFVDRLTGEFYPTPYEASVERGVVTVRLREGAAFA